MRIRSCITALLLILLHTSPANATGYHFYTFFERQTGVGSISGKIMGNLEAVSGAEVVLMQNDNLLDKTQTDEKGNYSFKYINPGKYQVKATKEGYRTSIITDISVTSDKTIPTDFYLPKFNNDHMDKTPVTEPWEENYRHYMKHK